MAEVLQQENSPRKPEPGGISDDFYRGSDGIRNGFFRRTYGIGAEEVPCCAVEMGEYASTSGVVREALRDWSFKRQLMLDQLTVLKQDLDKGLADVAAGRTREFDPQ